MLGRAVAERLPETCDEDVREYDRAASVRRDDFLRGAVLLQVPDEEQEEEPAEEVVEHVVEDEAHEAQDEGGNK